MAVRVWTGAYSSELRFASNWLGGTAPVPGDRLVFTDKAQREATGSFALLMGIGGFSISVTPKYPFNFGTSEAPLDAAGCNILEFGYRSLQEWCFLEGTQDDVLTIFKLITTTSGEMYLTHTSLADGSLYLRGGDVDHGGSFSGRLEFVDYEVINADHIPTISSDYKCGGTLNISPQAGSDYGFSAYMDIKGTDLTVDIPRGKVSTYTPMPGVSNSYMEVIVRPASYNAWDKVVFNYLEAGEISVQSVLTLSIYSHTAVAGQFITASHLSVGGSTSKYSLYGGTFSLPNTKLKESSTDSHKVSAVVLEGNSVLDLRAGSMLELLSIPSLIIRDPESARVIFGAESTISVQYT